MTLAELFTKILSSNPGDWNVIPCAGGGSGPSYGSKFTFADERDGQRFVLDEDSHSSVAAFRPDLSITMAWGLSHSDDFEEPWANGFPDKRASSSFFDVFYNNALVYRGVYVMVDGGRAKLPLPKSRADLVVPVRYSFLVRLLDQLDGYSTDYTDYFRRAGFKNSEVECP
jgi:hypothetical protein